MERQVRAFLTSLELDHTYSQSTCLAYDNDLRCFVGYLQKTLDRPPLLSDFNAHQVSQFLRTERQAGRRPSTILRRRASLRCFASFLRQQVPGWDLTFEPGAQLVDESISGMLPDQKPQYLTPAEVDSLWTVLEASPSPRARRDEAILALMLESGLAVGTLLALDLTDLDWKNERLLLRGKNGQGIWLPLGKAAGPLQKYLIYGRPELNYHAGEPALFISQIGGRMSRQGIWQVLRQWGSRAQLTVQLSPRLARHTAAQRLACDGRSLAEIQALLGHSNPLSTQALLRRLATSEKRVETMPLDKDLAD